MITIPAEPADASLLPPLLQGFGAVPPLITDINLSLDDKFLYVSCWGTGEFLQFDVSDPFNPKLTGSVHLGGIVRKAGHGNKAELNGGPQMVEVSRDGKRVYLTNSLYASWDAQFYPGGIKGWAVKLNADPDGGMSVDPDFLVDFGRSARTRSACRAATRHRTRTATPAEARVWVLGFGFQRLGRCAGAVWQLAPPCAAHDGAVPET